MRLFIILMLFVLFISCNKRKNHANSNLIEIELKESKALIENLFTNTEILKIETNIDCLIHDVSKVIFHNDKFYIFDRKQFYIFIFNRDGKLFYKLDKVGRGAGEYQSISDFTIDKTNNSIILLSEFGIIYNYNIDSDTLTSIYLPSEKPNYQKIEVYDKDNYIVWSIIRDNDEDCISIISKEDGRLVQSLWNNNMIYNYSSTDVFYNYKDTVFFSPSCFINRVYKIVDNQAKPSYEWDFGKDNIENFNVIKKVSNKNEFSTIYNQIFDDRDNGNIPYGILRQFQNDKYYYAYIFYKNQGFRHIFYSKENSKHIFFNNIENHIDINPDYMDDKVFISHFEYNDVQINELKRHLNENDIIQLDNFKETDNPCLILFFF